MWYPPKIEDASFPSTLSCNPSIFFAPHSPTFSAKPRLGESPPGLSSATASTTVTYSTAVSSAAPSATASAADGAVALTQMGGSGSFPEYKKEPPAPVKLAISGSGGGGRGISWKSVLFEYLREPRSSALQVSELSRGLHHGNILRNIPVKST